MPTTHYSIEPGSHRGGYSYKRIYLAGFLIPVANHELCPPFTLHPSPNIKSNSVRLSVTKSNPYESWVGRLPQSPMVATLVGAVASTSTPLPLIPKFASPTIPQLIWFIKDNDIWEFCCRLRASISSLPLRKTSVSKSHQSR